MNPLELSERNKKIIELLTKNDRTLTEITNALGISKSGTLKHLNKLSEAELIKKNIRTTEDGRESYYTLNNYTFFFSINPNTDSIIEFKTVQPFKLKNLLLGQVPQEEFKTDLKELFNTLKNPPFTILYGSTAKGEATWKSDIDLLFLKDSWENKESILNTISDVNMKVKHQIKPEFRTFSKFKQNTKLMNEIKDSGKIIYGELDEHPEIWKMMKRYRNFSD